MEAGDSSGKSMSPKILIVTRQWNNKSWGHARRKRPAEITTIE